MDSEPIRLQNDRSTWHCPSCHERSRLDARDWVATDGPVDVSIVFCPQCGVEILETGGAGEGGQR